MGSFSHRANLLLFAEASADLRVSKVPAKDERRPACQLRTLASPLLDRKRTGVSSKAREKKTRRDARTHWATRKGAMSPAGCLTSPMKTEEVCWGAGGRMEVDPLEGGGVGEEERGETPMDAGEDKRITRTCRPRSRVSTKYLASSHQGSPPMASDPPDPPIRGALIPAMERVMNWCSELLSRSRTRRVLPSRTDSTMASMGFPFHSWRRA